MFTGGGTWTVPAPAEGYSIKVIATDADGIVVHNSGNVSTGVTVPAGAHAYAYISVMKNPLAAIVPADVTAAALTFQSYAEATLNIVDSHITVTSPNTGYAYIAASGDYQGNVTNIEGSTVQISRTGGTPIISLFCDLINTSATVNTTTTDVTLQGTYKNVKNIVWGALNWSCAPFFRTCIQATDCDNFAVSPTIFPGLAAAQTANMPFIFQGCNVPDGRFYHHAQIANTYKNIDFSLAQADLGKQVGSIAGRILASSEVEGMYRIFAGTTSYGALVETYDSVKSLTLPNITGSISTTYGTTIYADAYLNGIFDLAGTNVFGNTKKHDTSNTQDVSGVLVKGIFNATTNGSVISGVVANNARAVVAQPFRVSGAGGVSVSSPAGVECNIYLTDATNKIIVNTGYVSGNNAPIVPALPAVYAYIAVKKTDGSDILPTDEFKGVTVTVYNGCKIVNTGATAVNMKGNIRVEDNATLVNAGVVGTGYFGGNSVVYCDPSTVDFNGTVYMKDNAVFAPKSLTGACALIHMEGNAKFVGSVTAAAVYLSLIMAGNAIIEGTPNTRSGIVMYGNSRIAPTGIISVQSRGVLTMKDNASIEENIIVKGAITLAGNYKGNVVKTWVGKRTITDVNEPEYDNNVKTQYDF
jgi:hypothetical protein